MRTVSTSPKTAFDDAVKIPISDIINVPKTVTAVDHFIYTNDDNTEVAIYRILFDDGTFIMTSANGIVVPIASYLATYDGSDAYPFAITVITRTSKNGRTYYALA